MDIKADVCIIPPNSFALAKTVEYFRIPRDVLTVCVGKSTYARCGLIVNVTPFEPEWEGFVTLEISNTTPLPAKVYANEGIAQVLFFQSDEICEVSYADKKGKYQKQQGLTLPRLVSRQLDAARTPSMARTEPARGMRDFLPEDVRRREYVIGVIKRVYERYGFEPLETPAVENLETLLGKYGDEGNQLIFKILKRGEHEASGQADLALRYDLTVPLARVDRAASGQAAAALQALSDSAGVARRPAGARALPRVLPVRRRRARLDVAGRRGGAVRGGVRRARPSSASTTSRSASTIGSC